MLGYASAHGFLRLFFWTFRGLCPPGWVEGLGLALFRTFGVRFSGSLPESVVNTRKLRRFCH